MKLLSPSLSNLKIVMLVIAISTLTSCHKNVDLQADDSTKDLSTRVNLWFGKIKAAANKELSESTATVSVQGNSTSNSSKANSGNAAAIAITIENLTVLEENLLFNNAIFTEQDKKYDLIVIPINEAIKGKKHVKAEASLNLVLVTDKRGKLISGNIMSFYPSDKKKRNNFSPRLIADFLKGKPFNENGKIRVLSLTGRWLREFDIKDRKLVSYGNIEPKNQPEGKKNNSFCIEWSLITTYYFPNGTTYQTSEYVGTTCEGCSDSEYEMLCPIGEGGSGGGANTNATTTETVVDESDEYIEDATGGPSSASVPLVLVKHEFVKYMSYDYWGLVGSCYYVDVHNAQLVVPGYHFVSALGYPSFMIATLSRHFNTCIHTTAVGVMVRWTYYIDVGVVETGGTDWSSSTYTIHTRVG